VSLVDPVSAALAGAFLFLAPGLVLLALLRAEDRDALRFDEALYLAVAFSVGVSSWIALTLAEAGLFSLVRAGALVAAAAGLGLALGRRRIAFPLPRLGRPRDLLPALGILALALSLQTRPSEYLVGGRDPGAYVAAMGFIARHGGLVYTDPVVLSIPREDWDLFYRHSNMPEFAWNSMGGVGAERSSEAWQRFMGFDLEHPQTGRVIPQFFHLFPAFGAYLFQAFGVRGALATPCIFAVLGTLGVFFTTRRLFGAGPALVGAGLLGVNAIQVWFARYPVSENVSQFLVFLGLLCVRLWEEHRSRAFAAAGGIALGLTLLVRIDSILIVAPLVVYAMVRRARGDLSLRDGASFFLPFGVLAGHALFHGSIWSKRYLLDIVGRKYWSFPAWAWLAAAAAVVTCLALAARLGPLVLPALERRRRGLALAFSALLVALGLYAYFLRPELSAWAGGAGHSPPRPLPESAALGLLRGLGFQTLAAHDAESLVRLGWFVSPLGLVLSLGGLTVVLFRWRRRYLLPVLTALAFSLFYFYKIRVFADYFFAYRRFLPVTLPFLMALIAVLLFYLARRGLAWRAGAVILGLTLATFYLRDLRGVASYVDWRHAEKFVRGVARYFGPGDVLIFEQPKSVHLLSLPLWALHGTNALEFARYNPDPDKLNHLLRSWHGKYRNIYFVYTYRTDLCGVFLQHVEDFSFGTAEWFAWNRYPAKPEARALRFTVARFVLPEELRVPALHEVDVGGTDDFQVSNFHQKEGGGERTYRWTGQCSTLYVPGAVGGTHLSITAAVGERPADRPARVRVSLSEAALGEFVASKEWTEHVFPLPVPRPAGPPLLRFQTTVFRPVNVFRGATDVRDLGVMVDRVAVLDAATSGGAASSGPSR
jgi:hypothetical protein